LAFGGLRYYPFVLARSWGSQLPAAPEDQIADITRCIARLGEPGIPVLVRALGSDREAVGHWAKEAIQEEMGFWKELPADEAASRWTVLADALASQPRHFAPDGRARAAELAAYVLRRHGGNEPALPDRVVAACQRALWLEAADRGAEARAKPQPPLAVAGTEDLGGTAQSNRSSPGGSVAPGSVARSSSGSPGAPQTPGGEPPLEAAPLPPLLAGQSVAPPSAKPGRAHDPARLSETSPVRPLTFSEALPPAKDTSTTVPAWSEAVELMRRLHAADARVVEDARAQLARWGFTPVEREVAKRMFHPDTAVRKELARALPGLPGLDAAPWLIQLAGDEDAEVRLAAITLLLTTSDPALVQRARRLAEADPDPRIRDQAERVGATRPREGSPAGTSRPSPR